MRFSVSPPGAPAEQHPTAVPRYGYLTPKLAADFTGISLQELERLRREGGGPPFCRVSSRLVRYKVEDVCDWLDSFKVSNTSEAYERDRAARQGARRE